MGTCAGQRVLGVLSSRRTFVRTSQLPPPSPPLSPFADSPFPRLPDSPFLELAPLPVSAIQAVLSYPRTQLLEVPQSKCGDVRAS